MDAVTALELAPSAREEVRRVPLLHFYAAWLAFMPGGWLP